MSAHVITVTGPTGSGKSTVLRAFLDEEVRASNLAFAPVLIPKYTTRSARTDDGGEVVCVPTLPPACDLVYEQYEARYGLEMGTLFQAISEQRTPIVILNDIRAVEDIRRAFGKLTRSIFVFRHRPERAAMEALARQRGLVDEAELERRYRKGLAILRTYTENIHVFDHVLLNARGERELIDQVVVLARSFGASGTWPLRDADV